MGRKKKTEEDAVDLLGQLSVNLGGTEYLLRPSRQAISNIQRQLGGRSLTALAVQASGFGMTVEEAGVCVAEMMRAYGQTLPADEPGANDYRGAKAEVCADLIYEAGESTITGRLAIILTGALTGGYTASGERKAEGMKTTEPTPTAA